MSKTRVDTAGAAERRIGEFFFLCWIVMHAVIWVMSHWWQWIRYFPCMMIKCTKSQRKDTGHICNLQIVWEMWNTDIWHVCCKYTHAIYLYFTFPWDQSHFLICPIVLFQLEMLNVALRSNSTLVVSLPESGFRQISFNIFIRAVCVWWYWWKLNS